MVCWGITGTQCLAQSPLRLVICHMQIRIHVCVLHNCRHRVLPDAFGAWVSLKPPLSLSGHWSLPQGLPSMCRVVTHSLGCVMQSWGPHPQLTPRGRLKAPGWPFVWGYWYVGLHTEPFLPQRFQRKVISLSGSPPLGRESRRQGGACEVPPALLAVPVEPCLSLWAPSVSWSS